jgi:hypothetical protein
MVRWPEVRYWLRAPRTGYFGSEPWQSTQALGKANAGCAAALDFDWAAASRGMRTAEARSNTGSLCMSIVESPRGGQ